MTKLGRTVGADRTVLRPYLGARPAVIDHVFCLTFVNIVRGQEKAVLSPGPFKVSNYFSSSVRHSPPLGRPTNTPYCRI